MIGSPLGLVATTGSITFLCPFPDGLPAGACRGGSDASRRERGPRRQARGVKCRVQRDTGKSLQRAFIRADVVKGAAKIHPAEPAGTPVAT